MFLRKLDSPSSDFQKRTPEETQTPPDHTYGSCWKPNLQSWILVPNPFQPALYLPFMQRSPNSNSTTALPLSQFFCDRDITSTAHQTHKHWPTHGHLHRDQARTQSNRGRPCEYFPNSPSRFIFRYLLHIWQWQTRFYNSINSHCLIFFNKANVMQWPQNDSQSAALYLIAVWLQPF